MTLTPEQDAASQAATKAAIAEADAMWKRRWAANAALVILDNAEEVDWWPCDECGQPYPPDEDGESDGLCEACYDACHFTCDSCGEHKHQDDRSDEFPELCTSCGCDKHTEVADGLWAELEDLAGSWSGEDYEIKNLKKLLAYAKRLRKPE
jgi:hypothetical protein